MVRQRALHISASVADDQVQALEALLDGIQQDPGGNALLPFGRIDGVHFGRLMLLPASLASPGPRIPNQLVLTTNFDGAHERHLQQLVEVAGQGLDRLFTHCTDYPPRGVRTPETRLAYLQQHAQKVNALYVNTRGRSVAQVAREAKLRTAIENFLDNPAFSAEASSARVKEQIVEFVRGSPDLRWALDSDPEEPLARAVRWGKLGLLGLAALFAAGSLVLFPLLLLLPLLFIALLRSHELGNLPSNFRPPSARIAKRESEEDHQSKNQVTAVGYVQSGPFRRMLLRFNLWLLNFANENLFYRGELAGVDTIHFARWVVGDSGRRVLFLSNYDGSPESYQDDFIERVSFGLNLVFSNGRGWPRTRFLFFGGSQDEQAFRAFYRDRQARTHVWYTAPAYDGLSAVNLARNSEIRRGLATPLNESEAEQWLQLL